MRQFLVAALLLSSLVWSIPSGAEPGMAGDGWVLRTIGDGLHTLEFDSTATKSTIVEFEQSIALIEVALSDEGGGARVLREHREGGEAILRILAERFPDRPLTHVLHTHWHPHSIASVAPFLEAGATLVTTRANFERVQEFVDPQLVEAAAGRIVFVEGESLAIGEGRNAIVAHRLLKEDYPSVPTTDYLFFEIPGQELLQCGCMYGKWRGGPVMGREVLTSRERDLYRFIGDRGLELTGLVRLNVEDDPAQVLSFAGLQATVDHGITSDEISARYEALDAAALAADRNRLVRESIADNIPPRIFNTLVFEALRGQDLDRALEFASIQVLVDPANANAWDTLGEVHYFMGELETARAYEAASRRIDPGFDRGGVEVWEDDLATHREIWAQQP